MERYERLKEITKEIGKLQREREILEHSIQQESQKRWLEFEKRYHEEREKNPFKPRIIVRY